MVRSIVSLMLLASMLTAVGLHAAEPQGSLAAAQARFKALDRDGDRKLSRSEVSQDQTLVKAFATVDSDSDGFIGISEYVASAESGQQAASPTKPLDRAPE